MARIKYFIKKTTYLRILSVALIIGVREPTSVVCTEVMDKEKDPFLVSIVPLERDFAVQKDSSKTCIQNKGIKYGELNKENIFEWMQRATSKQKRRKKKRKKKKKVDNAGFGYPTNSKIRRRIIEFFMRGSTVFGKLCSENGLGLKKSSDILNWYWIKM